MSFILFRSMICLLVLFWFAPISAAQEDDLPESPVGNLHFTTIHTDGDDVHGISTVPDENGEMVTQSYTVHVPYTEGGVTRIRRETRTRQMRATKRVMHPLSKYARFYDLSGKSIERKSMIRKVPMAGLKIVTIRVFVEENMTDEEKEKALAPKIPEAWSDLLRDDVKIMVIPHSTPIP